MDTCNYYGYSMQHAFKKKKRNLSCVSSGVNVRDVPEDASKHEKQIAGVFPTMKLYSLMCRNAVYGNDWCQQFPLNHLRGTQPLDSLAVILDSSLMTRGQVADDVSWCRPHGSLPFCQWLSDSSTSSKQTPSKASCIYQKMPLTLSAYLTWKKSIIPVQNRGCCVVSWDTSHKQTDSTKTAAI